MDSKWPATGSRFAVLLQEGYASLGDDGRLRITDAGRQAGEEEEWLEGWGLVQPSRPMRIKLVDGSLEKGKHGANDGNIFEAGGGG
jgi:hypothetical protein